MFCIKCGAENPTIAAYCYRCSCATVAEPGLPPNSATPGARTPILSSRLVESCVIACTFGASLMIRTFQMNSIPGGFGHMVADTVLPGVVVVTYYWKKRPSKMRTWAACGCLTVVWVVVSSLLQSR